ncbi:MAG TPA: DUF5655 domain-containing protein [Longimicrobiaceae bacterium]|nr:DUF5655 domain-containing protein [Longimicrobiaceae bacterium]
MPLPPPLWHCPRCGRPFANRNQPHSCTAATVEQHLAGKDPHGVALYHRFEALVRDCGPFVLAPARTRIGFQVRMIFAAVSVKDDRLDGHVVLARRLEHPRFRRVESFSPRSHAHYFRLRSLEEIDGEVAAWVREAYAVGEQKHLRA